MEDRLRNIKHKKLSADLAFTEQHRKNILHAIQKEDDQEEAILIAILQLLNEQRTGFELLQLLHGRGITKFAEKEGMLYLLLHELEKKEMISSIWTEDRQKYYQVQNKGRKVLKKVENRRTQRSASLQKCLRGDLLYE